MADKDKQARTDTDDPHGTDRGYLGFVPDQPPNEAYTVAGVTSDPEAAVTPGAPTGTPKTGTSK